MQKSSLPVGIKTLMKYEQEGKLNLDCPVQRKSGKWNNKQQSLLVHSILADYIVPNLYFAKDEDGILNVLDGKQRLTTVFSFINDEWRLHASTPEVVLNGEEYDIALKLFSELDADVQSELLGYRFTTYQLENCTEEDIEETFSRLNSGTPLSKIELARPKLGSQLATQFNELTELSFFTDSLKLTKSQRKKEDEFLMLITITMLLDALVWKDFAIKTSASAEECLRYCEVINGKFPEDKFENVKKVCEYLSEAFGDSKDYDYLRKNNIPVIGVCAYIAGDGIFTADEFSALTDEFFSQEREDYQENSGAGNVKLTKVTERIRILLEFILDSVADDENTLEVCLCQIPEELIPNKYVVGNEEIEGETGEVSERDGVDDGEAD